MRFSGPGILGLLLVLVLSASTASAKQLITWVTPDWRPYYILDGPDKGTGYSDVFRNYFEENLPEYTHRKMNMTVTRYLLDAKEGKTDCFCDMLKTPEREEVLYFSNSMVLAPALRIFSLPDGNIAVGPDNTVSLEALLQDPNLRTVIEKARSYDTLLDSLIRKYEDGDHVNVEQITPERIFELLLDGRIDYLIEYPFALYTTEDRLGRRAKLLSLKIKEQIPYTVAYVTCSKTPLGKKVIAKINAILEKGRTSPEYKRLFMLPSRIMDEHGKATYEELWDIYQAME